MERKITHAELVEQFGEDIARLYMEQNKEPSFEEKVNRWGGDVWNFMQKAELPKSSLEELEEVEKTRKKEQEKQQQKEKTEKFYYNSLKSKYKDELVSVFRSLENEIYKNYKSNEFENFKDSKGLAHEIVMPIINEYFSEEALAKSRYQALGMV